MNENYKNALAAEALKDENIANNYNENEVIDTVDSLDEEEALTGNWEEDLDTVLDVLVEDIPEEEEEPSDEEVINEAVEKLHIGFNFIPGLGFGYCKDEEDLAKMKEFVRGGMSVASIMGQMMGF